MFIRSERLFLRPGWPEDWSEIFSQIADEAIVRNLATAPWPYTAEAAREYAASPQELRYPHFLVTLPGAEGSRLIGTIGIVRHAPDEVGAPPELGYWIARDQWNRGYATEAARAVLHLAGTLGHRRLLAHHFVDTPASGQVLRKAGFFHTGRTAPRWSLARGESAPAEIYEISLATASDCGGDEPEAMRAA